jgi:drug/metabolite transporter (DMT)-like permease
MNASGDLKMGLREWALLLGLSLCWGCSFVFFKVLGEALPLLTLVFARAGVGALILLAIMLALRSRLPRDAQTWRQFFVLGFFNCVATWVLGVWGVSQIQSGLASILNATAPVSVVLLAHFLTRDEKLNLRRSLGVVAGIVGVGVLIGPSALRNLGGAEMWAQTAMVIATVFGAYGAIYGRRFSQMPPLTVATGQMVAATLLVLPFMLIFDQPWTLPPVPPSIWLAVVAFALICTVFAYLLFFRLLASAGATNLQLATFLIPVVALFLGWIMLGETLPLRAYAGMAVISLGLILIDGRMLRWMRGALGLS